MYRATASRIRTLKGHAGNWTQSRFASSSAVAAKSSGGQLNWFTGGSASALPPLDFPLKGIELPPSLPDHVEPESTKITTLSNGINVASVTTSNPGASIGLYVICGSTYETPASFGATHLLERMAFKSTANRRHLRAVREVEALGGNVTASASREQMRYTYEALKTYVPQMVELLVDSVRNQAFLDWEVKEQIEKAKAEIGERAKNPEALLLEAVHSVGYVGPLANPVVPSEGLLSRINSKVLEDFVAANYTAPRMVLAASGVEHEELLKYAKPLLSDLPRGDQMLMGGGESFSLGAPGKGVYSRLSNLRVLNEHPEIQSFSAFSSIYSHTALFGIKATTGSEFVSKAIDIATKELIAVATKTVYARPHLNRAKQATKSAILMNLESRLIASEDIRKQILAYGKMNPVEHFLEVIDEVTPEDINSIAKKLLSSCLTMASHGDVTKVPSYNSVSNKFK